VASHAPAVAVALQGSQEGPVEADQGDQSRSHYLKEMPRGMLSY